jgi:hypothetical protein
MHIPSVDGDDEKRSMKNGHDGFLVGIHDGKQVRPNPKSA